MSGFFKSGEMVRGILTSEGRMTTGSVRRASVSIVREGRTQPAGFVAQCNDVLARISVGQPVDIRVVDGHTPRLEVIGLAADLK